MTLFRELDLYTAREGTIVVTFSRKRVYQDYFHEN